MGKTLGIFVSSEATDRQEHKTERKKKKKNYKRIRREVENYRFLIVVRKIFVLFGRKKTLD